MLELLRNSFAAYRDPWDWEALRRSAVATSLQVLRSRPDAEDAAQEALIRAWRARARCAGGDGHAGWVGCIARNEALRLAARIGRQRRLEQEIRPDLDVPSPEAATATDDRRHPALVNALSRLSPIDAALVRLRYVEDLQYSEIAERLGMPLGTVKVRLHRLHTRLRSAADEGISGNI